jgi:hypothetical protein
MRDTSDRQLQLDFQRRAPEPCNDCSDLSARASSAFHDARPTSVHAAWFRCGVFFRLETVATLTSGAPRPLPRQRVNAAGFNASSGYLRSAHAAASLALGFRQQPAWLVRARRQPQPTTNTPEHDNAHQLLQSTQSPSTLAKRSLPGAEPLFTARRCALRRPGGACAPTIQLESQRRARHGSRLSTLKRTSQSPAPASTHWR